MIKALFIDDNQNFRQGVITSLQEYFHDELCIYQAPDCKYASHLLKDQIFDLIMLDIRVSGENGLDLIPEIRARSKKHIPIIVLSNFELPEYEDYVLNAGADAYIAKCSDCFLSISGHISHLVMQNSDVSNLVLH